MATVLVTGGTGFVGIHVARALALNGHRVICLARHALPDGSLRDAFFGTAAERIVLIAGDVRHLEDVQAAWSAHHPTHLVHAAAITPTPDMERAMAAAVVATNVAGTANVLDTACRHGAARVVYVSSAGVYGDTADDAPIEETSPLRGHALYAITKQTAERLCEYYERRYAVPIVAARAGWVYGTMERPLTGSREQMSLVYECVRLALKHEEVRLHDLDPVRDWIDADDLARAVMALLFTDPLPHRVYNCAGPRGYSHAELLDTLARIVPLRYRRSPDVETPSVTPALTRRRRGPLSVGRILADTDYRPAIDLETGLRRYVEWVGKRS
jgi:nucleoside-diphosphate-sugar epimerase